MCGGKGKGRMREKVENIAPLAVAVHGDVFSMFPFPFSPYFSPLPTSV